MNEKMIAPCPFCGSQAELMEGHRNHWRVECPRCGVRRAQFANGGIEKDKARAIRSWNKRSAYNPNERLREALEGGTISQTSFDGHAVRIDFETRAEASSLFEALSRSGGEG